MKTIFVLAPVAVGLFGVPGEAFAHAHLKSATPAVGGTVTTAPHALALTFSERLNIKFTGVTLSGPNKAAVATGEATLGADDDTTLVVPIPAGLTVGSYKVDWHALATDGHKSSGSYTFTLKP